MVWIYLSTPALWSSTMSLIPIWFVCLRLYVFRRRRPTCLFPCRMRRCSLEFAGASYSRLFGDRRNLFNRKFWQLLVQIDRFNKEGSANLYRPDYENMSVRQYAEVRRYGDDFLKGYLVPMSSALWSTPPEKVMEFPVFTLLRFFANHGAFWNEHATSVVDGRRRFYRVRQALTGSAQDGAPDRQRGSCS